LSIAGLTGLDKVYDGNYNASVSGSPILVGVLRNDTVILEDTTYYFATSEVGSDVEITNLDFSLSGPDADNYFIIWNSPTLSASITPKPLSIAGLTGLDKVYDGNWNASVSGSPILVGVLRNDTVILEDSSFSYSDTDRFHFTTSEVGTDLEIISLGYWLSGSEADNYILTKPTLSASITAKLLNLPSCYKEAWKASKSYNKSPGTHIVHYLGNNYVNKTWWSKNNIPNKVANKWENQGVCQSENVYDSTATAVVNRDFDLNDSELGDDADIDGTDAGNYSLFQPTLNQDITVNLEFTPSVNSISFQFNPYSGLVEFDLGATESPSIRVMNSAGQIIHRQVDISSADYTLKLLGARGLYFIEITDKVGQARGFSVMKK
jgi:hypothetical protein